MLCDFGKKPAKCRFSSILARRRPNGCQNTISRNCCFFVLTWFVLITHRRIKFAMCVNCNNRLQMKHKSYFPNNNDQIFHCGVSIRGSLYFFCARFILEFGFVSIILAFFSTSRPLPSDWVIICQPQNFVVDVVCALICFCDVIYALCRWCFVCNFVMSRYHVCIVSCVFVVRFLSCRHFV